MSVGHVSNEGWDEGEEHHRAGPLRDSGVSYGSTIASTSSNYAVTKAWQSGSEVKWHHNLLDLDCKGHNENCKYTVLYCTVNNIANLNNTVN